jgi:AcrR family transcriptional regulator
VGTVHRATVDALAQHGPRRTGVTHIARLAGTNRPYLYRNWPGPEALIREATLAELERVLHVAGLLPDPVPPAPCIPVHLVVRAARLLREHPVIGAMARTGPELAHAAVLRPDTVWHDTAWTWLYGKVTHHLPRGSAQDTATRAVFTTALPYALTPPPDSPDPLAERAAIDRALSLALHPCLGLPLDCRTCTDPQAA